MLTKTNKISIVNRSANPLPGYETKGSAGMDIRANLTAPVTLKPMERILIPTGLFIELPEGYEAQIRPRSGLAIKNGIILPNSPGTIDSDYRGEIKVIMANISNENFVIHHGDRIAQLIINRYETIEWQVSEKLSETVRGTGGFGHTGKK